MTDLGGVTSHTAIVARSLDIPAVVGAHNARQLIREDELLIVDGSDGVVIVNPDKSVLAEYRLKQSELELARAKLKRLKANAAATLDGAAGRAAAPTSSCRRISPQALEAGADGVGLFRTRVPVPQPGRDLPSEDEQFEAYRAAAEGDGKAAGHDPHLRPRRRQAARKASTGSPRVAPNPALGLRAIRFCLAEPAMFLTQLRAILRASRYGKVRMLVPMLAQLRDRANACDASQQAKETLREQGIPFDRDIKIGGMIEIPAAVLAIDRFLRRLDFVSIGTNDLIQYTLAIDRSDDTVAHLYDPLHPAVLRLIAMADHRLATGPRCRSPSAARWPAKRALTRLMLGFGLRNLSMHPAHLLSVKQRVLGSDIGKIAPIVGAHAPQRRSGPTGGASRPPERLRMPPRLPNRLAGCGVRRPAPRLDAVARKTP